MRPAAVHDVTRFLAHTMVAEVATRSPRGNAFVTPLWFVADRGRLYMTSHAEARASRNVAAHPAVVLLFANGGAGGAGEDVLRIRGVATLHEGLPPLRVLLRIACKYYAAPRALLSELANVGRWGLRARYYAGGRAAYLEVVPAAAELLSLGTG
jgi:hypothetical protein